MQTEEEIKKIKQTQLKLFNLLNDQADLNHRMLAQMCKIQQAVVFQQEEIDYLIKNCKFKDGSELGRIGLIFKKFKKVRK